MRRITWRGYEVSFHNRGVMTYSTKRTLRWDVVLHLPFGAVNVGTVTHGSVYYRLWYAQGLDWYVLGRSAHAWERNSTAESVTLQMLDQAYPDLDSAA